MRGDVGPSFALILVLAILLTATVVLAMVIL